MLEMLFSAIAELLIYLVVHIVIYTIFYNTGKIIILMFTLGKYSPEHYIKEPYRETPYLFN